METGMRRIGFARAFVVALLAFVTHNAQADAPLMPYQEYGKLLKKAEMAQPLSDDLFGESINLYNGSTEFSVTDIDLPGNSALPVRLGRRFRVEARMKFDDDSLGGLGDWDIEVPYLSSYNWNEPAQHTPNRCSDMWRPYVPTGFKLADFWHGSSMHIPGQGDQRLLYINHLSPPSRWYEKPTSGGPVHWGTRNHHRLSCIPMSNGYPGQGFLATDANGIRYYFDVGFERQSDMLYKRVALTFDQLTPHARFKTYIVVRRMEDRFGNWVNYDWSGSRLNSIVANDGRSITLTYDGVRIYARTNTARTWTYEFNQNGLSRVILPDLSEWNYQRTGTLSPQYPTSDYETADWRCLEPLPAHDGFRMVATHPSGAVGTFDFGLMRHRRSGLPQDVCQWVYRDFTWGRDYYELAVPEFFDVYSIGTKTIDGPGLQPRTWQYWYDIVASGRTGYGSGSQAKNVYVIQPDGTQVDYRFGIQFTINDGRLLQVLTRDQSGKIVRSEAHEYMTQAQASQMPFPEFNGGIPLSGDEPIENLNLPLVATVIHQDGDIPEPPPFVGEPPSPPPPPQPCWETGECPPPPPCTPGAGGDCDAPTVVGAPAKTRDAGIQNGGTTVTPDSFTRRITAFDAFVRPLTEVKSSSLGFSKTETTTYHDNLQHWVVGQVATRAVEGIQTARTDYWPHALPQRTYAFGKPQHFLTYHADGSLASITDGNNNTINLSSWKRGIPQLITHPATPDQPNGATESASVDDNGWITSVVDENGYATGYGYDAMGRISAVVYPTGDSTVWNNETTIFEKIPHDEHGLPAGHWRSIRSVGNKRTVAFYDALWRPVVEQTYDLADIPNTISRIVKGYDTGGRLSFHSYPIRDLGNYWDITQGTRTTYDALGRVTQVAQDSEHGPLATTTQYVAPLQTLVTNPRGFQTTTGYYAWDQPTYDLPGWIVKDVGNGNDQATQIQRDVFGKPVFIRQSGYTGGVLADRTRSYVYNVHQRLCKSIEPETASTVMDYDSAGNLAWTATGHDLPDTSTCNTAQGYGGGRRIDRAYDGRNRLKELRFPDGRGNQVWHYAADSLPTQITTYNEPGNAAPVVNTYAYNKRRLLVGEGSAQPNWYGWGIGYGYDANGSLVNNTYPTGLIVNYAPNALGQPTAVTSHDGWTYASGISYYPNGAIQQFTYGNGLVHSMLQNARQLPSWVMSSGGAQHYEYHYDANGNPGFIGDHVRGSTYHRWMEYDGLDRLTAAGSASFTGDHWHRMTYNAIDNITSWTLNGAKDFASYYYDATNRLTNIRNSQGSAIVGIGYDAQGNVNNHNGQEYVFDFGNRLREAVGKEWYRYDGHGRRVMNWRATEPGTLTMYSQSGQLLYDENHRASGRKATENIYLAGSLISTRARNIDTNAWTVSFHHTDALGSPVAATNTAGQVVDRIAYQPWGRPIAKPTYDGIGYTGHVRDGATQLTYMQQRYYDETIGRFLSVDPVTAYDSNDWRHFNRYAYAYNNPYKFKDPDGRVGVVGFLIGAGIDATLQTAKNMSSGQSFGEAVSNIDAGDVLAAGAVSAIIPGLGNLAKTGYQGTKAAVPAVKAMQKIAEKAANTPNRAAKNADAMARNIGKVEKATADVGKATVTAGAHQVVKAEAQSRTPEAKASEVREAIKPPPPPQDKRL
jgi:RHS repeat-associated protein